MNYTGIPLTPLIHVEEIFTIHYFEYASNFSFSGEKHDFWEFICVDKGEVEVIAGTKKQTLTRGMIQFHQPNEFHSVNANHKSAPNLVVISFCCRSKAMDFFCNQQFLLSDAQKELLARLISQARSTFSGPLNNPYQTQMELQKEARPGSLQMIGNLLELFLLSFLEQSNALGAALSEREALRRSQDSRQYERIVEYLNQHLDQNLSIGQIARDTLISPSTLSHLIKKRCGCGVISFFLQLKIQRAKELIRENKLNFTEISEMLGYRSLHYFSRQFKQITGMTPSEYSSSILGLSEEAGG